MKKTLTALFVALALLSLAGYALADVSGTWEMTREGRDGPMTSDFTIKQDGSKITVTMPGRQGGEMVGEGTIDGNAIQWTITRETQRGEMVMEYKGTVDGDSMSGTMSVMDRESEWTAKKK
ncbi:MAG: hypothetical protein WBB73_13130 [Candidatus Aminicenantaceae bacterium]